MMTKYVAKHTLDDGDDADHEWYVEYEDGGHLVSLNGLRGLRESEAKIIAFALNAVAEGRVLTKLMPPSECHDGPRYAGFYCHDYDGPTDLGQD